MKMRNYNVFLAPIVWIVLLSPVAPAIGKVSEEEAKQVGLSDSPLTPLGAIRGGNQAGTIPQWDGGIRTIPSGYVDGKWYVDPYSDDKVLLTISKDNYLQYKDKLSPGTVALFERYPDTYKINIYKSRRSASYPDWFYQNSLWNARNTIFCSPPPGPNQEERCLDEKSFRPGLAFPIPKTGGEAMWNHSYYFFGKNFIETTYGFNAFADGTWSLSSRKEYWMIPYYMTNDELPPGEVFRKKGKAAWCFAQEDLAPPRAAGTTSTGCNYMANVNYEGYLYVPGQRRVRKAPELGFYDSPGTGSDGLRTADSRNLFIISGDQEWYRFSMPVRKEMYVPYNSYKIASPQYGFKDIVRAGHVNQELTRWELHRVWVVEATLKEGFRHLGPHRFIYLDEDSWAAPLAEMYDGSGRLWRVSEGYLMNFYNVPMVDAWGDSHMDLLNGRQSAMARWFNEGANRGTFPPDFKAMPDPNLMTPAGLRQYGTR
jgi:hypothetical protein